MTSCVAVSMVLEIEMNQKATTSLVQYCLVLVMVFVASTQTVHSHHHLTVVDIEALSC